jgi:NAD(P)H-nitrite reductase large subunit
MHHLIVGAGPAGIIAAENIRKLAPKDSVTVVGDEPHQPYSRMAIPYLLMNNINEKGTLLRKNDEHFVDSQIKLVKGRVAAIDPSAHKVTLANGATLTYDKLLLAAGSHAANPPIPGIDSPGVHHCWTLKDAGNIAALAKPGARVLQMGAGFIGCIILEALVARGVKLTVVEMGDRMVPRMMGPAAGGMIKAWVQSKGVAVLTDTRVQSITGKGPLEVTFSNGKTETFDLVICATGVKPNIAFLSGSGISCKLGILTDASMRTNQPDVFAAGDCAEAFDVVKGQHVVSAIQPVAAEQARVAAFNMVGKAATLGRVPTVNVLDTLGLISTSFGSWEGEPGGEHAELTDPLDFKHISLQFKGDALVGSNTVGWTEHVGALRGLIDGHVKLGHWKKVLMQDPTQLMNAYLDAAQNAAQWAGAADARRR